MPMSATYRPRRRDAGMTLLEAVFALLLLAVCLVPAAQALRAGIAAPVATVQASRDLDCVSGQMETVLSYPYDRLLGAAGAIDKPSSYSAVATVNCPAVSVFIARYGIDATRRVGPGGTSNYLLYVGAQVADAPTRQAFPLTTLVAR